MFTFSERSRFRLVGVHPDLVLVLGLAIQRSPLDLTVIEGPRNNTQQKKNVENGASQTLDSNHLLTAHDTTAEQTALCRAVDVAPYVDGSISWAWTHYDTIAPVIKQAAIDLGIEVTWGGDWSSFRDGPHWELSS